MSQSVDQEYDYIIVGAGSTGCVLANRLSEDPHCRILLIEAGPADHHPLIHMPKGIAHVAANPRYTWQFLSSRVNGKPEVVVKGKTLGGSSAINAMIYTRGQREDFDAWAAEAGPHWNSDAMVGAFRAIENHGLGAGGTRGVGGPVGISQTAKPGPFTEAAMAAGRSLGLPPCDDINEQSGAHSSERIGLYNYTIHRGRRVSAADAFLKPIRRRPNLRVLTGFTVSQVLIAEGRAIGVSARQGDDITTFRARGEVILSAGAIMSPAILQYSGIGPADTLRSAGIEMVVDAPGIGGRLLDHLGIAMQFELRGMEGLNRQLRGIRLVAAAVEYAMFRRGPLSTGLYEVGGFVRTRPNLPRPDAQIYVGSYCFKRTASGAIASHLGLSPEPGLTIYGQHVQPRSEGRVDIVRSEGKLVPRIMPNWLSDPEDRKSVSALLIYLRRFARQDALSGFVGDELVPGRGVSDDRLLEALPKIASVGQHMVGSCRMGKDDRAPLDPWLRVRGITGLRVADCSAMPGIVSGNTNAAAMAFGWLAADIIRRKVDRPPQIATA